jgi:hypothetical protein
VTASRVEWRLAAILSVGMVGNSRYIEHDEVGTISRQRTLRLGSIEPRIESFGGRIVKSWIMKTALGAALRINPGLTIEIFQMLYPVGRLKIQRRS